MPTSKPNILWVVTTQWRAQACGYAGDPNARTPAVDALAGQSINYAQAVTPHPFGPLARAAMLTGVASPANGVCDYFDPLPELAPTIAHALAAFDYQTAYFGKWHLGPRARDVPLVGEAHARTVVPPSRRGGFEFWEAFEGGFLLNDPWLHGTRLPEPVQLPGYQSDVVGGRASVWLAEASATGRPWFAVVSLEAPHPPYGAPAAGQTAPDPAQLILPGNVPRGGEVEARARRELAGYCAHVAATDRAIGQLVATVDSAATVVVFTSVHGDMHGAHGLFRKGWPHEESVRVPLLVRHPAVPPRRDDSPVSLQDLPAMTQAWAVGVPWSCPRDRAPISMPSVVHLPDQCDRIWRGFRTPERKLVRNDDGTPWLYFDLAADPLERNNLAGDPTHAAEIRELDAGGD
ncbi:MAG: sulfatase-like hydrolase/transferase [Opitutales bacterium]